MLCLTPRQAKHSILAIDTHLTSRLDIVPSSVSVVSSAFSEAFPFTHLLLLLLLRLHASNRYDSLEPPNTDVIILETNE